MNMNYRLTEEEAKDGLDGLLPTVNKGAMRIGAVLLLAGAGMVLYNYVDGLSVPRLISGIGCILLAGWFFMNRMLSVNLIGRRAAGQEYLITVSPDGWVRTGKDGEKISFAKEAYGAETKLTVSFKPDEKHMYVVPKRAMSEARTKELIELLEALKCPIRRRTE